MLDFERFHVSVLTSGTTRDYSQRVASVDAIGFESPCNQGAQPPSGFFCAQRSTRVLWRAGRGNLRVRRSLGSGLSTPLGRATSFESELVRLKPPTKEAFMPGPACAPAQPHFTQSHVLPINRALDIFSLCDEGFDSLAAILFQLRKQVEPHSAEYHLATAAMSLTSLYSDLLSGEKERAITEVRAI